MGNEKLMFVELEKAAALEPNKETYNLLHKAYESHGRAEDADLIADKLKKLKVPQGKPKRILRSRRVVI
jgi:hypothetical protein